MLTRGSENKEKNNLISATRIGNTIKNDKIIDYLDLLDEKGLTEHGSCIPGWLTEKGKHLLDDLNEYFNKNKE